MDHRQKFLWVCIILAVTLIASVCALFNMDVGKERDTILYGKFLIKLDDKR
jgi:hypothetical protein